MRDTAYFVKSPSRISRLLRPHRLEDERPYEIVKCVYLSRIDFENFAADMTVDRSYIEQNAHLCGMDGSIWRCLLIRQRKSEVGILVMPVDRSWVGYAAVWILGDE